MAVCNVCGTIVEDGVKACPNCGTPIPGAVAAQVATPVAQAAEQTAAQVAQTADQVAQAAPAASAAPAFMGSLNSVNGNMDAKNNKKIDALVDKMDGKDFTGEFNAKEVEDNKLWAILAYFGILFLIPLFAAKESKYAKFHTNQGILACIVTFAFAIVSVIFCFIPFIKTVIAPFFISATAVIGAFFFVYGVLNACQDRAKELPVIGKIRILK